MSDNLYFSQFGISEPVLARKISNKNLWSRYLPYVKGTAIDIASDIFTAQKDNSLYLLEDDDDVRGFVASLNGPRTPQNQRLDFICMTEADLRSAQIKYQQTCGTQCLAVKDKHFDAEIDEQQAIKLCEILLSRKEQAYRLTKSDVKEILAIQREKGCISVVKDSSVCISCCR